MMDAMERVRMNDRTRPKPLTGSFAPLENEIADDSVAPKQIHILMDFQHKERNFSENSF